MVYLTKKSDNSYTKNILGLPEFSDFCQNLLNVGP